MPIVTSEKFSLTIGTLPNEQPGAQAQAHPARPRRRRCRTRTTCERHLRRAGHERHERAHDRHEAPEDHRLAAVLLEERVRARQMVAIQQPVRTGRDWSVALKTRGPISRPTA